LTACAYPTAFGPVWQIQCKISAKTGIEKVFVYLLCITSVTPSIMNPGEIQAEPIMKRYHKLLTDFKCPSEKK
jgi:hypothetical protein